MTRTVFGWAEAYHCGDMTLIAALEGAIAQARAERDGEWRAAFTRAEACGAKGLPPATYGVCKDCIPLRALLEGK